MREAGVLFNMLLVSQRWADAVQLQQQRLERMVPASQRTLFDIAAMEQLAQAGRLCCTTPAHLLLPEDQPFFS